MMHRLFAGMIALALAATMFAHEGEEHVTGTVKAVAATSMTVENAKKEAVAVILTTMTEVTKSGKKAALADIKVGDRVVVHAEKAKDGKLQAHEVQIGAAAKAAPKTAVKK